MPRLVLDVFLHVGGTAPFEKNKQKLALPYVVFTIAVFLITSRLSQIMSLSAVIADVDVAGDVTSVPKPAS